MIAMSSYQGRICPISGVQFLVRSEAASRFWLQRLQRLQATAHFVPASATQKTGPDKPKSERRCGSEEFSERVWRAAQIAVLFLALLRAPLRPDLACFVHFSPQL